MLLCLFLSFCLWFLQPRAISCMRLKFDYQMAVYELYEYGDVHDMICYCVFSFCLCFFTDKCNILHEAEVSSFLSVSVLQTSAISCTRLKFDYQMNVYELYEYGDVLVMNCNCVSHNLCFRAKIRKLSFFFYFFLLFLLPLKIAVYCMDMFSL